MKWQYLCLPSSFCCKAISFSWLVGYIQHLQHPLHFECLYCGWYQVTVEGQAYHKSCFKCSHGGCPISPSNYAALEGILYCKHHFSQLFKEKGSYNHLIKCASIKRAAASTPDLWFYSVYWTGFSSKRTILSYVFVFGCFHPFCLFNWGIGKLAFLLFC